MPLSRRLNFLIFVSALILALSFIGFQSYYRVGQILHLTELADQVPPIEGVHLRKVMYDMNAADSTWWVMHTEEMLKRGDWRVRFTERDNVPEGREVHWSSGLVWMLTGCAWIMSQFSTMSIIDCVEYAGLAVGPLMGIGFLLLFGFFAYNRWNGTVAGILILAMATLPIMDELFRAGEADHHGIVAAFCLGAVLALIAAGAGRVATPGREEDAEPIALPVKSARKWMIASGILGAAALWVSAATATIVICGIAAGAILAAAFGRIAKSDGSTIADPWLWRLWGQAGAIGSMFFYLLEYFPGPFYLRLEVNHPLFAIAWLSGGELLARICAWISFNQKPSTQKDAIWISLAIAGVALMPLIVLIGGSSVFTIKDTFLWRLHADYINEFKSMLKMLSEYSWIQMLLIFPSWLLLVPAGIYILLCEPWETKWSGAFALALGSITPAIYLSIQQIRWTGLMHSLSLVLGVIVVLKVLSHWPRTKLIPRIALGIIVLLGFGVYPTVAVQGWRTPDRKQLMLTPSEAIMLVTRDSAYRIRASYGNKPIVIVSGPTTTTNLCYYGDTKGVGTLYWENTEGLKASAAIYGAKTHEEALRLCKHHQVTHIALYSWDAFAQQYARLHHGRAIDADTRDCFVMKMIALGDIPQWIRPIRHPIPPGLNLQQHWILIFEVVVDQTPTDAALSHSRFWLEGNNTEGAIRTLNKAYLADKTNVAISAELAKTLILANRTTEAESLAKNLPPDAQFYVYRFAGGQFADAGKRNEAAAALRKAVAIKPTDSEAVTNLAWILATNSEAGAREGAEAEALMLALFQSKPTHAINEAAAYGLALAAQGKYDQAIQVFTDLAAKARTSGTQNDVQMIDALLAQAQLRQPIKINFTNQKP